jgi:RNA polymerase sigma factor (sigma-70 family)
MTQRSDQEWIRLLQQGDDKATEDLWQMLYRDALRVARKYRQPDDVGYDAALKAYANLQRSGLWQFRFQSQFRSYCWTILAREVSRHLRRTLDTTELSFDPPAAPDRYQHFNSQRTWERLRPCVERLAPNRRRVFELIDLEGTSPADTAEIMGMKRNNVNQLAARARRDLRNCLEQRGFLRSEDVLGL